MVGPAPVALAYGWRTFATCGKRAVISRAKRRRVGSRWGRCQRRCEWSRDERRHTQLRDRERDALCRYGEAPGISWEAPSHSHEIWRLPAKDPDTCTCTREERCSFRQDLWPHDLSPAHSLQLRFVVVRVESSLWAATRFASHDGDLTARTIVGSRWTCRRARDAPLQASPARVRPAYEMPSQSGP